MGTETRILEVSRSRPTGGFSEDSLLALEWEPLAVSSNGLSTAHVFLPFLLRLRSQ